MKDHSIYGAAYNLNSMGFDWKSTLDNWTRFLAGEGQVSLAINTSTDNTLEVISEYARELATQPGNGVEYTITSTDVDYRDPLFDGQIKNEALKRCNRPFCSLLDMDEVFPLHARDAWVQTLDVLNQSPYDALFIPVIDLFHNEYHYKNLGQKWYIHRNKPYLKRGRVQFAAREDGSTNIELSDSCELIRDDGSLANAVTLPQARGTDSTKLAWMRMGACPYVVHKGWLIREQRLRQSAFWAPVWSARDGIKVEKPLTNEDLDKMPYYPHNLPHWNNEL